MKCIEFDYLLLDDFRSQIFGRAAETVQFVAFDVLLREPEVGDLDVPIGVEEKVFGLEVAVDDAFAVQIVEAHRDFGSVETSAVFGEAAVAEVEEELAAVEEVRNEVELGLGLKREAQASKYGGEWDTRPRMDVHTLP